MAPILTMFFKCFGQRQDKMRLIGQRPNGKELDREKLNTGENSENGIGQRLDRVHVICFLERVGIRYFLDRDGTEYGKNNCKCGLDRIRIILFLDRVLTETWTEY